MLVIHLYACVNYEVERQRHYRQVNYTHYIKRRAVLHRWDSKTLYSIGEHTISCHMVSD